MLSLHDELVALRKENVTLRHTLLKHQPEVTLTPPESKYDSLKITVAVDPLMLVSGRGDWLEEHLTRRIVEGLKHFVTTARKENSYGQV